MSDYKRVRLEDGATATVVHVTDEMTVIDDPATDKAGRPLPAAPPAPALELTGKALDEALRAVDLPTTGKADEKRDRLAEHQTSALQAADITPTPGAGAQPSDQIA